MFIAIDGVEISEAESGPCPVCKHPTGDCTGDTRYSGAALFRPKSRPDPAATFIIPERVYDVQEDPVTNRKRRRLLYQRGDRVRPEVAKTLGFLS